ncbi:SDR family oxidoreductase [Flavobacterium sedimenticola]|uniref:SDR family NAD(P)-dependent oxidoreductase n=1 Tax=Flavobacterium sedimenticola TaxID=3043286 RepID=A0ABT6XSF8_9FLAO|nr:SDR family NAD(P)-dependent oxidoreductase [Flavobacterium sedimenticola]MDI9257910.1 SDR family NAD(P)-dependent oxidoreductase [Flavobacterium sedimenticola]
MKLSNNVILITGGTSGIGLEMVRTFYSLNNKLIVASKSESKLDELKKQFPTIEIITCDLGDNNSVKNLINECLLNYKKINIIINNAGIQYNYSWMTEKYGYDKIENEIRVNLTSPMQIIYGLLPLLLEKQNAAIINISSGLAFAPKKSAPIYCATKAAIHNATKSIRYQLEHTTIKVFEIIPPLVDTPMTEGRGTDKISSKKLVEEFLKNFEKGKLESNIGKTKLLRFINRIAPKIAQSILKNG